MGLRFFKRGNKYSGVSDALHSIRQEFEAIWGKIDNYIAPEDSVSSEQNSYIPEITMQADTQYKGMFVISLITNTSGDNVEHKITVREGGVSVYAGIAKVNSDRFYVDSFESDKLNTDSDNVWYVRLKYTPEGGIDTGAGGGISSSSVDIELCDSVDSDTEDNAYYYIGKVEYSSSTGFTISQWHTSGEAMFYFGVSCDGNWRVTR
jgi:hypothetical protein